MNLEILFSVQIQTKTSFSCVQMLLSVRSDVSFCTYKCNFSIFFPRFLLAKMFNWEGDSELNQPYG